MPLTGSWTLTAAIALALAAVAATAALWNRIVGRAHLRWPARLGMILVCQVTACVIVAIVVNNSGQFFTSWSDLLGKSGGVSAEPLRAGAFDRAVTRQIALAGRRGHSLVVSVLIPDAGGSRAHRALVYLPSAYFQRAYANRDFPAIELLQGYPASPKSWTGPMDLQHIADSEIAAGRAEPFVAVIPTQNYVPHRDSECINAVGGSQVDTTLTVNVRRTIDSDFRVSPDRRSWAVAGYSTGGFCAVNMAVRHADMFTAAASLSGYDQPYIDRTTGQLFRDSRTARDDNNPLWRLEHLPPPDISLLLAASLQDHVPSRDARQLAAATRPPTRTDLLMLPRGGHNFGIWKAMEPVMIDWLARIIMPPLAPGMLAEGAHPVPGTSPISVETAPAAIVRAAGHKGDARGKRALGGG